MAAGKRLFKLCQSVTELYRRVFLFLNLDHELLSVSLNLEQLLLVF